MNKEFIDKMEEKLLTEKKEILDSFASHNAASQKILGETASGDSVDEASDAVDLNLLDSMDANDMKRLEIINAALARINMGKYGYCMKCGKEISEARLEAIPYAVLCVNCKTADERRSR